MQYAIQVTDAPLAYHLGVGLTILSVTLPQTFGTLYAGPLRGNLYTMLVGRSGEDRKSASLGIGRRLLAEADPKLLGSTPGSTEGLADTLDSRSRVLIDYSELGEFLAKTSQSGGYLEPLKTMYGNLWDAQPYSRKTKKGDVVIPNPRLSLLAACARPYLEAHTAPEDWTGGFMGRWLVFYAKRERTYALPDREATGGQDLVDFLRTRSEMPVCGPCLGLDAEARRLWVGEEGRPGWYESINARRMPSKIVGIRARVPTFAMKIAALLAWDFGKAATGEAWWIGLDELIPAIMVAELHARSIAALSDHLTENKDMRDRANVLFQLEEGPLPFAELLRRSHLLAKRLRELIETLLIEKRIAPFVSPGFEEGYALLADP